MISLKKQDADVADMLERIRDTFSILAEVRDVELGIACPEGLTVCCDESWMTEALSNIVKNALEHTPAGGRVAVEVSQNNLFTAFRFPWLPAVIASVAAAAGICGFTLLFARRNKKEIIIEEIRRSVV